MTKSAKSTGLIVETGAGRRGEGREGREDLQVYEKQIITKKMNTNVASPDKRARYKRQIEFQTELKNIKKFFKELNHIKNSCKNFESVQNKSIGNTINNCEQLNIQLFQLRFLVYSRMFRFRKQLDALLNLLFPKRWMPLYSMVRSSCF